MKNKADPTFCLFNLGFTFFSDTGEVEWGGVPGASATLSCLVNSGSWCQEVCFMEYGEKPPQMVTSSQEWITHPSHCSRQSIPVHDALLPASQGRAHPVFLSNRFPLSALGLIPAPDASPVENLQEILVISFL